MSQYLDNVDNYIDVRTHGAVMNGVTDDTDAFISACNAANVGCGNVFIPPVTVNNFAAGGLVLSPIEASWRRLRIFGINQGGFNTGVRSKVSRILLKPSSSGSLLTLLGDNGTSAQNIMLEGLMFDGNKAAQGAITSHGIYLPTVAAGEDSFIEVKHCYLRDFVSDCINSEYGRRATKVVDTKMFSSRNGWNCASSDGWLDKCDIGQMSEDGIQVHDWTIAITGNNIFTCRNGINLFNGEAALTTVIGNRLDRHLASGVRANGKNSTIMGNVFHRNSETSLAYAAHIDVLGDGHTIVGNTFKDGAGAGFPASYDIFLQAGTVAVVTGNHTLGRGFSNAYGHIGVASGARALQTAGEYSQGPRYNVDTTIDSASSTAFTLPADAFVNEIVRRTGTPAGAVADTTATATDVIANLGLSFSILGGSSLRFKYVNTTGQTITLTPGAGMTMSGTTTIANNAYREFVITINSATTATITNAGGGSL